MALDLNLNRRGTGKSESESELSIVHISELCKGTMFSCTLPNRNTSYSHGCMQALYILCRRLSEHTDPLHLSQVSMPTACSCKAYPQPMLQRASQQHHSALLNIYSLSDLMLESPSIGKQSCTTGSETASLQRLPNAGKPRQGQI